MRRGTSASSRSDRDSDISEMLGISDKSPTERAMRRQDQFLGCALSELQKLRARQSKVRKQMQEEYNDGTGQRGRPQSAFSKSSSSSQNKLKGAYLRYEPSEIKQTPSKDAMPRKSSLKSDSERGKSASVRFLCDLKLCEETESFQDTNSEILVEPAECIIPYKSRSLNRFPSSKEIKWDQERQVRLKTMRALSRPPKFEPGIEEPGVVEPKNEESTTRIYPALTAVKKQFSVKNPIMIKPGSARLYKSRYIMLTK